MISGETGLQGSAEGLNWTASQQAVHAPMAKAHTGIFYCLLDSHGETGAVPPHMQHLKQSHDKHSKKHANDKTFQAEFPRVNVLG